MEDLSLLWKQPQIQITRIMMTCQDSIHNINLRSICSCLVFWLFSSSLLFAQGKKPTLMVLPSENWCQQRYFYNEIDLNGKRQSFPDYERAFFEDTEIGQVITTLSSQFVDLGYNLKDAQQILAGNRKRSVEESMTFDLDTGSDLMESPIDILYRSARADVIIAVWWEIQRTDNGIALSLQLDAIDSFTHKRIASMMTNTKPKQGQTIPMLLEKAVRKSAKDFSNQILEYFAGLEEEGREIVLTVRVWENSNWNLESRVDGTELIDVINDWLYDHTVQGRFSLTFASETTASFEQVMMPTYDARGRELDARQFILGLRNHLETAIPQMEVKIVTRGLAESFIIIGQK